MTQSKSDSTKGNVLWKFIIFNLLGIFMFFIPITIGGKSSIPIDHVVSLLRRIPYFEIAYPSLIVVIGAILPFVRGTWKKDTVTKVFSFFKLLGIVVLGLVLTKMGPQSIYTPDMLPFIFNKVVIPVTILVPVGAVFLAFLLNYGLMEFIGVFMKPVMRPLWKTPGRSAVDAVASFVGSYSVGLLITNRVYKEGFYSTKEAAIIATGFSTVSATFMVIVAKTFGLMDKWNLYFWSTLLITFLVTAITARIYPLGKKPETGYEGREVIEEPVIQSGQLFSAAMEEGLTACAKAPSFLTGLITNFRDGLNMALGIGPTLLSIGFLGLVLANFTQFFDILGYIFLPLTKLLGFGNEAMLVAKGCALSLAEMFLPASILSKSSFLARGVMAIVCVSEILFFSASIPCVLGTDIDLSLKDIIIIWIERIVLTLLIAVPVVKLLYQKLLCGYNRRKETACIKMKREEASQI